MTVIEDHRRLSAARDRAIALAPGLALAAVVALAATALGARYDAPSMLFALLLGMALSFLGEDQRAAHGLGFAASTGLKAGVALLGFSVSAGALAALGVPALLSVAGLMCLSMLLGTWLGKRLGWPTDLAVIAAGAVSICGASAALALAALFPTTPARRAQVMAVVLTTTALSTAAMAFYPLALAGIGLSPSQTGFVLGASIHDVAQVVGAGYSVSEEVGEIAALTKMVRVCLLPAVLLAVSVVLVRRSGGGAADLRPPWFVVCFAVFFFAASVVDFPQIMRDLVSDSARALFLTAIAAIGLTSRMREILATGSRALFALSATSAALFLGAVSAALIFG
jgi:uncharacterized integral membrane protein (TIGR00698 family)